VKKTTPKAKKRAFDHQCDWREAALKLAKCVVATIKTGGKIGMGTGMVMKEVEGKTVIERWDKDFIEALEFIGLEVVDVKPKKKPAKFSAVLNKVVAEGNSPTPMKRYRRA
jgi:hypothetical protein